MNAKQCPYCGAEFPPVADAFCPQCRERIEPTVPTLKRKRLLWRLALASVLVAPAVIFGGIQIVRWSRADPPLDQAEMLEIASDHLVQQNYAEAMIIYYEILDLDPDCTEALRGRAALLMAFGNNVSALDDLNRVIEIDEKDAIAYHNRAVIYSNSGEKELAIADYEHALELGYEYADMHNSLAVLYSELGLNEEALLHYTAAIALEPEAAMFFLNRGACYFELGMADESIADLTVATLLAPEDYHMWAYRCRVNISLGEFDRARSDAEEAHRLNPDWTMPALIQESGE